MSASRCGKSLVLAVGSAEGSVNNFATSGKLKQISQVHNGGLTTELMALIMVLNRSFLCPTRRGSKRDEWFEWNKRWWLRGEKDGRLVSDGRRRPKFEDFLSGNRHNVSCNVPFKPT